MYKVIEMMKKLFFCLLSLIPCIAFADTDGSFVDDVNKPVRWSLGALSAVVKDLYNNHCKTDAPELQQLSDYIYKKNPDATIAEIAKACQSVSLEGALFRYDKKEGECPLDGQYKRGYVQKSGKKVNKTSCEYYVETLVKKQNEYADKYSRRNGLFVKKVGDEFGGVYKIVDFVSDNIGDDTAAKVYVVEDDDKIFLWKNRKIRYGKLSVNIQTNGGTIGINDRSYVFPNKDVTNFMLNLCQQIGSPVEMLVRDASELAGSLTRDVKHKFCGGDTRNDIKSKTIDYVLGRDVDWSSVKNMRYGNQSSTDCHTNMVVFQGELVTFDYLGHWLFGCMRKVNAGTSNGQISKGVEKFYDIAAAKDQQSASGKVKGQASDDGVLKEYQDEGSEYATEMLRFNNTQTVSPEKAIEMVRKYLIQTKKVKSVQDIEKCWTTDCKRGVGTQDYVSCRTAGGKIYQYEFDDICD